jgi:hypothetical protein
MWRTFAVEPRAIRLVHLVLMGSAGSPDTRDVPARIELHARATEQPPKDWRLSSVLEIRGFCRHSLLKHPSVPP